MTEINTNKYIAWKKGSVYNFQVPSYDILHECLPTHWKYHERHKSEDFTWTPNAIELARLLLSHFQQEILQHDLWIMTPIVQRMTQFATAYCCMKLRGRQMPTSKDHCMKSVWNIYTVTCWNKLQRLSDVTLSWGRAIYQWNYQWKNFKMKFTGKTKNSRGDIQWLQKGIWVFNLYKFDALPACLACNTVYEIRRQMVIICINRTLIKTD